MEIIAEHDEIFRMLDEYDKTKNKRLNQIFSNFNVVAYLPQLTMQTPKDVININPKLAGN